jgi:Guanine nucleotide exchange factor in Golgi transport N-terminal
LLRASQSDDLAVFSLALRVVFNLFVSIKDHMKVQLEVFLTSVHLRLLTPSQAQLTGSGKNNSKSSSSAYTASLAKEELALESLLEFCREPSLMEDLYTNYDCDVQCTNLFDSIISVLCIRAAPMGIQRVPTPYKSTNATPKGGGHNFEPPSLNVNTSNSVRVSILNKLALDGVFAVLHSIAVKCEKTHRSKRVVRNISNLLKAEAESEVTGTGSGTGIVQPEGGERLDSSVCSPFTEAPSPRPMIESAGVLVDQWCEVEDVSDSQKSVERNASSPAVTADSGLGSGSRPVRGSDLDLTHPGTAPSPALMLASSSDSQKDIRALTSAALSAHSSSSNSSSASVRLPFTVSTSSTPRASQLIVRGSNSSPFSANTSVDGRVDIVSSGDDDADFFLLARAKTAEVLRQRKLKKQRLRLASEKFNEKPLKPDWVHFALSLGLLRPAVTLDRSHSETKKDEKDKAKIVDQFAFADAESVAKFLRNTPGNSNDREEYQVSPSWIYIASCSSQHA